jgi:hypothetical protein
MVRVRSLAISLALAIAGAVSVGAQPFAPWAHFAPGYPATHAYIEVPHSPALNPTAGFTLEAWVSLETADGPGADCRSIAGKDFHAAWWVGVCNVSGVRTLRSYLKGDGSSRDGGRVAVGEWTHVAVVFDGARRRHYVNGELTLDVPDSGPLSTSNAPLRIGSDVSWPRTPTGSIDEVRLWNVARTEAELRAGLRVAINAPQPGLVAVWPLDGTPNDVLGPHDGVAFGPGLVTGVFATSPNCGPPTSATSLCLHDRFNVTGSFRVGAQTADEGTAQAVPSSYEGSGIFYFFNGQNWELMLKALDGCGLNNRYWIFNAGLTNLYFRIEVRDVTRGVQRIYFNYPGPPAPALTDVNALAVCP